MSDLEPSNVAILFKRITIHCSATPNFKPITVAEIDDWHRRRGMRCIGYHYLIGLDGVVYPGRPLTMHGAHVEGENQCNIGICLTGTDRFGLPQLIALWGLILDLTKKYGIPNKDVYCHYEFPSAVAQGKTCPNFTRTELHNFLEFIAKYG